MAARDARFLTERCSADLDAIACRSEDVSFDALVEVTPDHNKEDTTMRYMTIVKGPENAGVPPKELFDAIDKLIAEQSKSGVFVSAGGLQSSKQGASVRITKGKIRVTDGPFTEAKEVIGGFAILNAASKDEAIKQARRFMELHINHWPGWEGECEVREMEEGP